MLPRFFPLLSLSLAFAPGLASAQNSSSYLLGLAQALDNQGLTTLANIAASIVNDTAGQQLIEELQTGNKTVFAPSNEACTSARPCSSFLLFVHSLESLIHLR